MPLLDRGERVVQYGERREAEEVHLEHARVLETVHVVLAHDHLLFVDRAGALGGLGADGHVVVHRSRRDDDAGGVDARVPRESLERRGVVEQLAVALVGAIQTPDVVELLDRLFDGQREVRLIRNQLGERVGLRGSETERAADVLDGRARFHRPERHDLADGLAPVFLPDVLDHLAAPLEAEVHVDVGHRDAFRIEEALEQEVVDRADRRR